MAEVEAINLAGLFTTLVSKISSADIASHCKAFAGYVTVNLDGVLADVEKFDISISSQVSEFEEAKEKLRDSMKAAFTFVGSVADFFYFGKMTKFESIKSDIKKGNSKKLEEFLYKMNECLKNIGIAYADLEEKCKIASLKCAEGAERCTILQAKARKNKIKTRIAGGTVSTAAFGGGLAAGGVAVTVFTGILTLGAGAVVGFSILAASLAATGVGTTTATHVFAHNFNKNEKSFRSMSQCFRELAARGSDIKHQFDVIHGIVVRYEKNHKFLNQTMVNSDYVDTLCSSLDLLKWILQSQYEKTSEAKDKMNTLQNKIENEWLLIT